MARPRPTSVWKRALAATVAVAACLLALPLLSPAAGFEASAAVEREGGKDKDKDKDKKQHEDPKPDRGSDPERPSPPPPPPPEAPPGGAPPSGPAPSEPPAAPTPRSPRSPHPSGCRGATTAPRARTLLRAERILICLLNYERGRRGLPALWANRRLRKAAARHSRDMVRRRYFAHDTKGGRDWGMRLLATGYGSRARRWKIGETLAWGAGHSSTPAWSVRSWLRSRPHRRVLFDPAFREVGIGLASGTPRGRRGVTCTADFGRVR